MKSVSTILYELKAYLVRRNARGEQEYHARHLGFHDSRELAEKAVDEQVGDGRNFLDTATRKLLYLELNAYRPGGEALAIESKVFDRWGKALME